MTLTVSGAAGEHTESMRGHIGMIDVLYQPPRGSCTAPEDALAEMDAGGVAVAFVSQCKQWSCERQHLCLDTRLEDVARFLAESIRFAGLAGYNPYDAAESLRQMEAARTLGFRGTYLHLASFGMRLSDRRLYPLFAKSEELGQPAVVQVPLSEPDLARSVERIGGDFPELSLAVVHPRPAQEMFALCGRFDGLTLAMDSAALAWVLKHQRPLLDEGQVIERCLWGSNGAPLAQSAGEVMDLELPLETLEAIVRTNALRFFAAQPPSRIPRALSPEITSAER